MDENNLLKRLLAFIEKIGFVLAILAIGVLVFFYFSIQDLPLSDTSKEFWGGLIINLIPAVFIFFISYYLFRELQIIKGQILQDDLLGKIVNAVKQYLDDSKSSNYLWKSNFSAHQQDINNELDIFDNKTVGMDRIGKFMALNKIGQNILSLAASIKEAPNNVHICVNLMVFDSIENNLRMLLSHGFYYQEAFNRVFSLDESRAEGSCGKAFRSGVIKIIEDVNESDEVSLVLPREKENMGSLINIPLSKLGVLNIDCPQKKYFVLHDGVELQSRLLALQGLGVKFLNIYNKVKLIPYN